jgi:pimeloyl-ACP methyl ester carboxylesterase
VPVAVPIVAGTAIKGIAAHMMMHQVLRRHPNAFLITLASLGVTIPLHNSQHHIAADIRRGLLKQDRAADSPVVLVGHSQGALASLRYAIDHPDQVLHTFSVGAPWHGSRSAARVAGLIGRTGRNLAPALTDMASGSLFLQQLHSDLPQIADRVTNIYTTREIVISPYFYAHVDVPGVRNVLIAPQNEYLRHLQSFPEYPLDDHIEARVTHLGEMSNPQVRSMIWAKVDRISERVRRGELGPGQARG